MTLPRAETSRRAPYRTGETWQERHERRMRIALDDRQRLEAKLEGLGRMRIRIVNRGAHWRIKICRRVFEWWPETGRVVVDQRWDGARKAHDVDQLSTMIVRMVKR